MASGRVKVLLVEDDGDSRELLAELLGSEFEVRTAVDGIAGLEAFEVERPDVLVTDESLPGLCGTALARKAKALRPDTRVVLVSGYGQVQDAEACDVILRKPIDVERLWNVMEDLASRA